MKKDLVITMEEECITCPKLSLVTDTIYMDNKPFYHIHQCEHLKFCQEVRKNWEKYQERKDDK